MVDVAFTRVPLARPRVQVRLLRFSDAMQLRREHLAQQGVIPIFVIAMVEGYKEQIRAGESPEDVGRTVALQNRIAERARQTIEDRRTREELEVGVGQPSEKLVTEVVGYEAVVPEEALHSMIQVMLRRERQGREVQPSRPTLGPLDECFNGSLIELKTRSL